VDILTTACGLLAAWAAGPACDAFLRWRRVAAFRGRSVPSRPPKRLLVLVPSRGEGARVGDLAADVRLEAGTAAASTTVDLRILLDGPDPDASARLDREGFPYLLKNPTGPAKGHVLAFLAERMGPGLDAFDFVLVFDADMRLPEGFFRDLNVPDGAEVFQLPVRPAGVPGPGAPRVEALSLAETRLDDLARDAEGLPVRLRGKAMGFSPRAFRLGPAVATRTTAEDSEATLALLAKGVAVRALSGPFAFDEPAPAASAMARSRARWFGGHLKLLATGFGDLLRVAGKSPKGAFVLACDLWLRPRLFALFALALLAIASDLAMLFFSSSGAWTAATLIFLLLLSFEAKLALVFEGLSIAALRRRIGYPPEVPSVTLADLYSSLSMWARAAGLALLAPSRWHRARPPA
jgi:cellulose synthase/poly-beta-1,6-N-acetylglucosamine synthase-like glycosyltransferase